MCIMYYVYYASLTIWPNYGQSTQGLMDTLLFLSPFKTIKQTLKLTLKFHIVLLLLYLKFKMSAFEIQA